MIINLKGLNIYTRGVTNVRKYNSIIANLGGYLEINYDFGGYTLYFNDKKSLYFWYILLKFIVFLHI